MSLLGLEGKKNRTKERFSLIPNIISTYFGNSILYNKNDPHQRPFEEDLMLLS
jgi:hypothetical protein